ncbi:hypothetical protein LFT45_04550 [Arthrobacter sp. FW305-BF8]|uniref:hypothetical protein n=1 Tax=Arthrobacter sp. FW305-BF8 TaxID=2879617 RepID=UPI001F1DA5FE|nr:hypothetical protein [Arthrobacter sp. FW305-BF8]UKA55208.1 hypothetical protein LFT45_04550 [Arthrobacter sp. FW305-BF8]
MRVLQENPKMPATVLVERVGWLGSPAQFSENAAMIRLEYAPADPANRISYVPGDQAQWDLWFPEVRVGTGKYPRLIRAPMAPSRMTGDLVAGKGELIGSSGAVPRRAVLGQGLCPGLPRPISTDEFKADANESDHFLRSFIALCSP